MSNYDKFVAEVQRELVSLASKLSEADWVEANADVKQLRIYLKEFRDYADTNYKKFKSGSKKTYSETAKTFNQLGRKLYSKWELGLDFIKITTVNTLDNINEWEIKYTVSLNGYELFLTANVTDKNVLISPVTKIDWHNDDDYELYTNLSHYKLLAQLKQVNYDID